MTLDETLAALRDRDPAVRASGCQAAVALGVVSAPVFDAVVALLDDRATFPRWQPDHLGGGNEGQEPLWSEAQSVLSAIGKHNLLLLESAFSRASAAHRATLVGAYPFEPPWRWLAGWLADPSPLVRRSALGWCSNELQCGRSPRPADARSPLVSAFVTSLSDLDVGVAGHARYMLDILHRNGSVAPGASLQTGATMDDKLTALKCTQCGAADLAPRVDGRLLCGYCGAAFAPPASLKRAEPRVVIGGNAHVVIGPKAHVVIRGKVAIEGNARVEVEGHLELLEPGDPERIRERKG